MSFEKTNPKILLLFPVPWTTPCWPYLPLAVGGRVTENQGHRLPERIRKTAASSLITAACSFNTLLPRSIGTENSSLLKDSSWLTGFVYTSNPWSLRQSSIRSSCRRCFCGSPFLLHTIVLSYILYIYKRNLKESHHIMKETRAQ